MGEIPLDEPPLYPRDGNLPGNNTFAVSVRPTFGFIRGLYLSGVDYSSLPGECRHNAKIFREALQHSRKVLPQDVSISDKGLDYLAATIAYMIRPDIIKPRITERPYIRADQAALPGYLTRKESRKVISKLNKEIIERCNSGRIEAIFQERARVLNPQWVQKDYGNRVDQIRPDLREAHSFDLPFPDRISKQHEPELQKLLHTEHRLNDVSSEIYRTMQLALESVKELYVSLKPLCGIGGGLDIFTSSTWRNTAYKVYDDYAFHSYHERPIIKNWDDVMPPILRLAPALAFIVNSNSLTHYLYTKESIIEFNESCKAKAKIQQEESDAFMDLILGRKIPPRPPGKNKKGKDTEIPQSPEQAFRSLDEGADRIHNKFKLGQKVAVAQVLGISPDSVTDQQVEEELQRRKNEANLRVSEYLGIPLEKVTDPMREDMLLKFSKGWEMF